MLCLVFVVAMEAAKQKSMCVAKVMRGFSKSPDQSFDVDLLRDAVSKEMDDEKWRQRIAFKSDEVALRSALDRLRDKKLLPPYTTPKPQRGGKGSGSGGKPKGGGGGSSSRATSRTRSVSVTRQPAVVW